MAYIEIVGGKQLNGEVNIQGSKNAVLPILAATVLINGISRINRCPKILDVYHMIKILEAVGCIVTWEDSTVVVNAMNIHTSIVPKDLVRKMRSSIVLMGAMIGRTKQVTITYPGGCTIGARPIDYHLKALSLMNVTLHESDGQIVCTAKELIGNHINLVFPSVGATENVILAAVLAKGITTITNAAKEPEIFELCQFLKAAGAKITGAGTYKITIEGVDLLNDTQYTATSDRIVAGTYLAAVTGTGGEAVLRGIDCSTLGNVIEVLRRVGATIITAKDTIMISSFGRPKAIPYIKTEPYPGFPTDMQSQMISVLMKASGESVIEEDIFEARYTNVQEQLKFGSNIEIRQRDAIITGVDNLYGANVSASELRGGAALVIAGLMANGKTTIHNPIYIERGYEDICRDLRALGADIAYVTKS